MFRNEKIRYLASNLARGMAWLLVLLLVFIFLKKNLDSSSLAPLEPFLDRPALVYLIYSLSEFAFGIIPPELFMIWALRSGSLASYVSLVASFAAISYLAGIAGYWIGYFLQTTRIFRYLRRKRLKKYEERLRRFGSFLLVVAALTPVPFSAICMLVGSGRYPFGKFLGVALTRFLRFGLYAWFVWEANMLS